MYVNKKIEELETIISFNYELKHVSVYSTRTATIKKLTKAIGSANKIDYVGGKIYSSEWIIPFLQREKIKKVLSITAYLNRK